MHSYISLILDGLEPLIQSLMYATTHYESVHRPRLRRAASSTPAGRPLRLSLMGLLQPSFLRSVAIQDLASRSRYARGGPPGTVKSTPLSTDFEADEVATVDKLRTAYAALDVRLASLRDSEVYFMSSSRCPTTLDAILFAHLMRAATCPHIIRVLQEYFHLSEFLRYMCRKYYFLEAGGQYHVADVANVSNVHFRMEEIMRALDLNNPGSHMEDREKNHAHISGSSEEVLQYLASCRRMLNTSSSRNLLSRTRALLNGGTDGWDDSNDKESKSADDKDDKNEEKDHAHSEWQQKVSRMKEKGDVRWLSNVGLLSAAVLLFGNVVKFQTEAPN
uniref:Uncharacterized protein n=1 Tax=Corethron hystrix TaxID=216773 RepID=A0A6U5EZC1_9STRA|mmetsp:Transcript_202/g.437  ORF Transcript_202/g.437 Transcript_202/m.437 type:complete len:333 (+) Transcript_202:1126-2124(+)